MEILLLVKNSKTLDIISIFHSNVNACRGCRNYNIMLSFLSLKVDVLDIYDNKWMIVIIKRYKTKGKINRSPVIQGCSLLYYLNESVGFSMIDGQKSTQLDQAYRKENIKALHYWSFTLWGDLPVTVAIRFHSGSVMPPLEFVHSSWYRHIRRFCNIALSKANCMASTIDILTM